MRGLKFLHAFHGRSIPFPVRCARERAILGQRLLNLNNPLRIRGLLTSLAARSP